ncbi:MAG: hypothetical protein FWE45_02120 [Firmicutes bacterium]|nr:hypothetical protein [Bacillota bacterium]
MEKEYYTSAGMLPQVVQHVMTGITNKDYSDRELAQINEICRDLQGMVKQEQARRQQQNQDKDIKR